MSPVDLVLARLEPHGLRKAGRGWRACCPAHGSSNPTTLSIGVGDDDAVLVTCFSGCSAEDIAGSIGLSLADLFLPRPGTSRPAPPPTIVAPPPPAPHRIEHRTTLDDRAVALFDACMPIRGVAAAYLHARCCVLPPADGDLRFHPNLRHPSGYRGPALVARITHVRTCAPMSLHQTWINADGTKADVMPPRMLLAGHAKAGGVIRLWPDEAVSTGLGIAEGIETALSLAHAFTPVWACIDAGNLAAFPVLLGIEALTIAADHDPAGQKAAEACAERWTEAGLSVRVVLAPRAGADLNDHARSAIR